MKVKVKEETAGEAAELGEAQVRLKPMKCELDYLSKSDGSAILAQGKTVVLASVNGPLDIQLRNQNIEKATFEVLYSPKSGKPSVVDRYTENIIRQACELGILKHLHPRTAITVTVQELEDFGGLMACCLNAVNLAFINSGLPMNYVFAAVSCVIEYTGNIIVDPSQEQTVGNLATMTFVFDSRDRKMMIAFTNGSFSESAYNEAMEKSRVASDTVFSFYREMVTKYCSTL